MPIDPSDHTVRTLAEILREHGLETDAGTRPGRRRRWDDPDDSGVERRRETTPRPAAGPDPDGDGALPVYGRRATDAPLPKGPDDGAGSSTSSISGLRTSRKPGVPGAASSAAASPPARTAPPAGKPAPPAATPAPAAAKPTPPAAAPASLGAKAAAAAPASPPARAAEPARGPSTAERRAARHRSGDTGRSRRVAERPDGPRTGPVPTPLDADPPTGKVPRITDPIRDDDHDDQPQGALAWARFVGELVVAVAVGVGVYFAFSALWELQPYAAVVAAPLVVTGLVGGVHWWRDRHRRGAPGLRMTAVLLFAGTLLTIAPAASLLNG